MTKRKIFCPPSGATKEEARASKPSRQTTQIAQTTHHPFQTRQRWRRLEPTPQGQGQARQGASGSPFSSPMQHPTSPNLRPRRVRGLGEWVYALQKQVIALPGRGLALLGQRPRDWVRQDPQPTQVEDAPPPVGLRALPPTHRLAEGCMWGLSAQEQALVVQRLRIQERRLDD